MAAEPAERDARLVPARGLLHLPRHQLPRGIKLAGAMYGIDCPQVIAMSGYSDAQMLRNWQTADQANYTGGASTFYSPTRPPGGQAQKAPTTSTWKISSSTLTATVT